MKKTLFLFVILGLFSCDPIKKLYVKFGDEKPILENKKDGVIRIFFDRQGVIYPDIQIPDSKIEDNYGRLSLLFEKDKKLFLDACHSQGLGNLPGVPELQQNLVDQKAMILNALPLLFVPPF